MTDNDFWQIVKKRIRKVTNAAADFTEEQALIGKLKFEILTMKRKVDSLQNKIGRIVYELSSQQPQPDIYENAEILSHISEIEELEKKIEFKRQEITEVADHFRAKSAAPYDEDIFQHDETEEADEPEPDQERFEPPEEELEPETAAKEKDETPRKTRKRKSPRRASTDKTVATARKRTPRKRTVRKKDSSESEENTQPETKDDIKAETAETIPPVPDAEVKEADSQSAGTPEEKPDEKKE